MCQKYDELRYELFHNRCVFDAVSIHYAHNKKYALLAVLSNLSFSICNKKNSSCPKQQIKTEIDINILKYEEIKNIDSQWQ